MVRELGYTVKQSGGRCVGGVTNRGRCTSCLETNWAELLAQLDKPDFSGKRIALFGLGAQERYPERFASSLMRLYEVFKGYGAELVGSWSTDGYTFEQSAAIVDGRFVGLVVDQRIQSMHTDERIDGCRSARIVIWFQSTPVITDGRTDLFEVANNDCVVSIHARHH